MRTVSQNEVLQRRIRRLMQSQHDHEKQWWQGREALCKKQKARGEKKKELDEVLRSVGAPVDSSKGVSTAEEDQTELNTYDAKIYAASNQMAQALTLELRGLGIPFFSIKRDLVTDDHKNNDDHDKQHKDKLPRDELSALQLRMLELLQDLCKE
ncbi:uncharacterized protein ASPGLDRAFT_133324 [Aspergillus glaucus CBS 516.65]|uniref:Uncharacterized protein n=1 Tax=Aspergillus glaucus CBS 516.65 TaxID=1160497 RepID=A0A1L9VB30_ASPGL|nr:hypothetical protein ASPGLDRAFT_133324 [Aspergillus glaucus CBS 516.65]OJJ81141.1 hypothetical protein ASPGLDRAFT_133324 [Aspergillus glaucus CBS 516.65]